MWRQRERGKMRNIRKRWKGDVDAIKVRKTR